MKRHTLSQDKRTGIYYARIQADGVRKKFSFSKNRRKSEQELRQLEEDIEAGRKSFAALANTHIDKSEPEDITIEDLVTRYLEWVRGNRAPRTWETAKMLLQPFVDFYGECHVSDLNHTTLSQFYAWARKRRSRGPNGGNKHMEQVKALLRWGEHMDVCLSPIRRFPVLRHLPPETKKFTDAELPRLLTHCDPDFRDLVFFGLLTGLRPHELRNLRREHIQQVGENTCVVLENHKTSMSAHTPMPRCVPLAPEAVAIVERQLAAHPHAPYIFVNTRDKQYTANGFRQRLARACRRAGLPPRPPYALRHYFGTKQAGNGCNQAILAQLMGHTTILTTTRYVARVPDYHQKAVNAMQEDLADLLRTGEQDGEGKQKAGKLIELRRLS